MFTSIARGRVGAERGAELRLAIGQIPCRGGPEALQSIRGRAGGIWPQGALEQGAIWLT